MHIFACQTTNPITEIQKGLFACRSPSTFIPAGQSTGEKRLFTVQLQQMLRPVSSDTGAKISCKYIYIILKNILTYFWHKNSAWHSAQERNCERNGCSCCHHNYHSRIPLGLRCFLLLFNRVSSWPGVEMGLQLMVENWHLCSDWCSAHKNSAKQQKGANVSGFLQREVICKKGASVGWCFKVRWGLVGLRFKVLCFLYIQPQLVALNCFLSPPWGTAF